MLDQYKKQAEISAGAEPTALIAMSGGVDSSVAARLMLEQEKKIAEEKKKSAEKFAGVK